MTAIWKRSIDLPALNALGENSLVAHLGIVFTLIGDDYLEATMPRREDRFPPHPPYAVCFGSHKYYNQLNPRPVARFSPASPLEKM